MYIIYTHIYMYINPYALVYSCVCSYMYMHLSIYTYVHTHIHTGLRAGAGGRVDVCIYIYSTCTHTHTRARAHTHTHTGLHAGAGGRVVGALPGLPVQLPHCLLPQRLRPCGPHAARRRRQHLAAWPRQQPPALSPAPPRPAERGRLWRQRVLVAVV